MGCDTGVTVALSVVNNFNPRTPVGCDIRRCGHKWCQHYFNPRTPVGCDVDISQHTIPFIKFQSTHPSGVRRTVDLSADAGSQISIHAPQWGAANVLSSVDRTGTFQSTHPSPQTLRGAPRKPVELIFREVYLKLYVWAPHKLRDKPNPSSHGHGCCVSGSGLRAY